MSASTGTRNRISLPFVTIWLTVMLAVSVTSFCRAGVPDGRNARPESLPGNGQGEIAGIMSRNGDFEPKVRVIKDGSSITVTKLDPAASFPSVSVSFIFPGSDQPDGMNDIALQWEKTPGRPGKEWALTAHKEFSFAARKLTCPWSHSVSFKLVDKSGKRFPSGTGWQDLVTISLNGSVVFSRPWPESAADQPSTRDEPDASTTVPDPLPARSGVPLEVPAKVSTINELADLKALPDRIRSLEERMLRLENAVAMTQNSVTAAKEVFDSRRRWVYWGPLFAMVLSVLFTTVSLYLTFTRLARGPDARRIPLPNHGVSRFAGEQRFRGAI